MGDFLVDLRSSARPDLRRIADGLCFDSRTRLVNEEDGAIAVAVTYTGDSRLWSPFHAADGTAVLLAGTTVFEEAEWADAESEAGEGGLACAAIYAKYRQYGEKGLEQINGNGVVLLLDRPNRVFHLVADRAGAFPAYECTTPEGLALGSHPDVLARMAGVAGNLDEVSMAEFLIGSRVTPPFTYYKGVRALPNGVRLRIPLGVTGPSEIERKIYFTFEYAPRAGESEADLAVELASGFRRAIQRRTSARLGTCALALSGGLDSRLLLACMAESADVFTFTCFDAPNRESQIAASVAAALNRRHIPLQRGSDFYAENAERGVAISAGMGTLANNHFLGVLDRLHAEGMQNLITGCYCDYLFKALPLNRRGGRWWGQERLAPFRDEFYFRVRHAATPLAVSAQERQASRIPVALRAQTTPEDVFHIERLRTFPLCYEGDNQQRLVPQRLTRWPLPVADYELLSLYNRIPYTAKLDRALFTHALLALRNQRIARLPDANTGVPPGAPQWLRRMSQASRKARNVISSRSGAARTEGSWPDWPSYLRKSPCLEALWRRPNPEAMDFFRNVLGPEKVLERPRQYADGDVFQFVALLTLKLWLDQQRG